jgi:hypothetical protein
MKLPNDKETWEHDVLQSLLGKSISADMLIGEHILDRSLLYTDLAGKTHILNYEKFRRYVLTEGYTPHVGKG